MRPGRSRSWDELAAPNVPTMDFVFTACEKAAAEARHHAQPRRLRRRWSAQTGPLLLAVSERGRVWLSLLNRRRSWLGASQGRHGKEWR